jgi:hypothetical protein
VAPPEPETQVRINNWAWAGAVIDTVNAKTAAATMRSVVPGFMTGSSHLDRQGAGPASIIASICRDVVNLPPNANSAAAEAALLPEAPVTPEPARSR